MKTETFENSEVYHAIFWKNTYSKLSCSLLLFFRERVVMSSKIPRNKQLSLHLMIGAKSILIPASNNAFYETAHSIFYKKKKWCSKKKPSISLLMQNVAGTISPWPTKSNIFHCQWKIFALASKTCISSCEWWLVTIKEVINRGSC